MLRENIEPEKYGITYEHPDYDTINYVHRYHPYFSDDDSEEKMVKLYKTYGMPIIKNMVYVARESKKVYARIKNLKDELEECEEYLLRFKEGKFTVDM